ncbi:MAG: MoxR family ATPase [Spirochaetales bacterium]|nr:MoxR family ATPase [Spirochaetales bacterium]
MEKYNSASETIKQLSLETAKGFLGKPEIVNLMVLGLVSGLHILIEDVSGIGKTTLVRCLAKGCGLDYGRVQFTPDLLPGDITGMTIWDPVKREFIFRKGPIHKQFLLADELNRAPSRTQSALLEAMQEEAVTVDGVRTPLPAPFFVAATQNPTWYAGTYNLPESQLDRFGLSISPGYPEEKVEESILKEFKAELPEDRISAVTTPERIKELKGLISSVRIDDLLLSYIVNIGKESRLSSDFQTGISTRGLQHLIRLAQGRALLNGRAFIIPEDLIESAGPVMRHRLPLSPEARSEGKPVEMFIKKLLSRIPIPAGFNP